MFVFVVFTTNHTKNDRKKTKRLTHNLKEQGKKQELQ